MNCLAPSSGDDARSDLAQSVQHGTCPRTRHFISGTFNSPSLHVFSFDTLTRTLSLLSTIQGYGPHSFLTPGKSAAAPVSCKADLLYATTWAENKPELCAWRLRWSHDAQKLDGLDWLGNVPITATSSYVHVQPPPYDTITAPGFGIPSGPSKYLYSAGGPSGEVHQLDITTGRIREKVQEVVFLKEGPAGLPKADKTRKALRYGAHNIDVGKGELVYIANVGSNAIEVHRRDAKTGSLTLLSEAVMPQEGDGPRHVVPSPCGKYVYSVTEHTSYIDSWMVKAETGKADLAHLWRTSILPPGLVSKAHNYRGDTVRLSPDGRHLFATTRGMHSHTRGFVVGWLIDTGGEDQTRVPQRVVSVETRNSGGKAHAIEFAPRYPAPILQGARPRPEHSTPFSPDWAVLTDDQEGYVSVLEWDGTDLRDVATVQLPALENGKPQGASQAVWIS